MSNVGVSRGRLNRTTAKWQRRLARWQSRRDDKAELDRLICSFRQGDLQQSTRPPAEPPPSDPHVANLMTNQNDSDNTSHGDSDSDDSLFGPPPPLHDGDDSSSSDESASDLDFFTASDGSSYDTAEEFEVCTVYSDSDGSSCFSARSLGPPPPGSVMDYWDKPIPSSCMHNFPFRSEDSKCLPELDAASTDSSSLDSFEGPGADDDTYASCNPIAFNPSASLTRIIANPRICLTKECQKLYIGGELVDTGGNFNMTNRLDILVNITAVRPFSIGMAAKEQESTSKCTHRGDLAIPMMDGTTFYTPVFYNAKASDTILSPHAICQHSGGLLESWNQSGSVTAEKGSVSFFTKDGAEVIALTLDKRNGLFYTPVRSVAVSTPSPS